MSLKSTIALDAMGGDFGPSEIVPAALFALKKTHCTPSYSGWQRRSCSG